MKVKMNDFLPDSNTRYNLQKVWEGQENFLTWQVQARTKEARIKGYLTLKAGVRSTALTFSKDKPTPLKSAGSLVSILRKECRTASLLYYGKDATGGLWMQLASKGSIFYIYLEASRPSTIHIVNSEGISICRRSSKGSYTKKKTICIPEMEYLSKLEISFCKNPNQHKQPPENINVEIPDYQKRLKSSLKRRYRTLKKSLFKLENSTQSPEKLQEMQLKAQLFEQNIHKIKPGIRQISLANKNTKPSGSIVIKLSGDLSPGEELNILYSDLKASKKKHTHDQRLICKTKDQIEQIGQQLHRLNEEKLSFSECKILKEKFNLKKTALETPKKGNNTNKKQIFRTYLIDNDYALRVGKGPVENDLLTKGAKSNDIWVHIVGTTGSHVIIPQRKGSGQPSQAIIKIAAILAVHYSKVRSDMQGEVYVTTKDQIKKRKGMPPGLWSVEKADTLYIKYDVSDLKSVLSKLMKDL